MATAAELMARRFKEWRAGGKELVQPGNLLGLKLGSMVGIDDPDYDGGPMRVGAIRVITETVERRDYPITEYLLEADDPAWLWIYPAEERDRRFHAIVFRERWSGPYQDAMAAGLYHPAYSQERARWTGPHPETDAEIPALQDPAGLFRDGEDMYKRRHGDLEPHPVTIRAMADEDGDGKLQDREIREHDAQYWDYEIVVGVEEPVDYLLFAVEDHDGWFRVMVGREIPFEEFTVIP